MIQEVLARASDGIGNPVADPLEHFKLVTEIAKNLVEVAGVLGAVFVLYKWLYERSDRATEVLLKLEDNFDKIKDGRSLVEHDEAYKRLALELKTMTAALGEIRADSAVWHASKKVRAAKRADNDADLVALDALLRFYVVLYAISRARQVPSASLRASYRYWLAHYFSPNRVEMRAYVDQYYPTLSRWLKKDQRWYRKVLRLDFFRPYDFGW